jgi:hypothetical protein
MSTDLIERGGRLEITVGGNATSKLIAVPLLLIGSYFAYQLIAGVLDIIRGRVALGELAVGTVLVFVMAGAFLVPGWLLLAARARIEIDRTARTVTAVRDLRLHQIRERRSLDEFERVVVDRLSVAPNRQSAGHTWHVEFAARSKENVLVGLFDDDEAAMAFARRVALAAGLPVDDAREREREDD